MASSVICHEGAPKGKGLDGYKGRLTFLSCSLELSLFLLPIDEQASATASTVQSCRDGRPTITAEMNEP